MASSSAVEPTSPSAATPSSRRSRSSSFGKATYPPISSSIEKDRGTMEKLSMDSFDSEDGPGFTARHSLEEDDGRDDDVSGFVPPVLPSAIPPTMMEGGHHHEERHLNLLGAVALVAGAQIGSGIFSSPGVIVASTKSIGASLIVWILGGLLAWTGASSYAELGSAIPLDGGSQAYLAYAYGPMASYLYTFTTVVAIKPGSAAIIALIFGEYAGRLVFLIMPHDDAASAPIWLIKLLACLGMILTSVLCSLNPKSGVQAAVLLTSIKVVSLIFVLVLGLFSLLKNGAGPSLGKVSFFEGSSTSPADYAVALYSGLWAYDGWDTSNLVAGQMINAARDLPRCIHISLTLIMVLYVFANLAYFIVLPMETIAVTNTIALDFGRELLGKAGGIVFTCVVGTSCFGALNGGVFTSARLIYAAAKESFLPKTFAKLSATRQTPVNAIALNAALSLFFIIVGGGFRSMVNFFGVITWTFYLATVLGLLYLRIKEPQLERPYKTFLITPVIFCGVAFFLLLMPTIAAPLEALAASGFIIAGVPAYYLTVRTRKGKSRGGHPGQEYHPLSTMARVIKWLKTLNPEKQIFLVASAGRLGSVACLMGLPVVFKIPAFDTSAGLLSGLLSATAVEDTRSDLWHPFLRWDGIFFADIAQNGYRFEQELAFLPLWPGLMRISGEVMIRLRRLFGSVAGSTSIGDIVTGGTIVANVFYVLSCVMLYRLSLAVGKSPRTSLRAALLYALTPAPAVMSSPYTEQAFAVFTLTGFWLTQKRSSWSARCMGVICLSLTSGMRSLGVLTSLVVAWQMVAMPWLRGDRRVVMTLGRLLLGASACLVVATPFIVTQALPFWTFCWPGAVKDRLPWCDAIPPLVYSSVQERYWNVGFLRYWEVAQIPNFALAAPVLAASFYGIYTYWPVVLAVGSQVLQGFRIYKPTATPLAGYLGEAQALLPYYVIHILTTYVLVFSSHTQIILRVSSGNPMVWWALADVCFEDGAGARVGGKGGKGVTGLSRWGRAWVRWVCVYGCISLVLWSGFYPPA